MIRKKAIEVIIPEIGENPIISANGFISRDLFNVKDKKTNFYMIGSMGLASSIGLGLAIAVFVDVTLVRALIAPSLMRIAGPFNWWLPSWLDKILPNISHEN